MSRRTEQRDGQLARAALRLAGGSREMAAARLRLQADHPPESADSGHVERRRRVAASLDREGTA